MEIGFYGATGTVTGSKYLLSHGNTKVLIDCGLFQGIKKIRQRNWQTLPFEPRELDAVILTHAHLDHSGYLPVLVRNGFKGKVICTQPTRNLCGILLPDAGHLQEEDARYAKRKGYSRHEHPKPLYTENEARKVLKRLKAVRLNEELEVGDFKVKLIGAGHILGAAAAVIKVGRRSILFSGDNGRPDDPLMHKPHPPVKTDYIVMESTYGDRLHEDHDPEAALAEVVNTTTARRGVLVIPSFAVGRAQNLMYVLNQLAKENRIPQVPVYLNSPMARSVTGYYKQYPEFHRLNKEECGKMFGKVHIVNTAEESKALNRRKGPMVIISASGMLTGGRVLHHLRAFGGHERNTILLAGYQAPGTRGASLLSGVQQLKIHGRYVPIKAEIRRLDGLSAHADQGELLTWLGNAKNNPGVILTHGEPQSCDALRQIIADKLGLEVHVPEYRDVLDLN